MSNTISLTLPITKAQALAIQQRGHGARVHHPRARTKAGRAQLIRALEHAGLPHRISVTLCWTTTGPAPALEAAEPIGSLLDVTEP